MDGQKVRNMEEFAALSGISRPTLSKYFHDPDSVRASTREKIEVALAEHDYRPNIFAINQNRRTTNNIGIVVPFLADPFFGEIARNLEQRCIAAGFAPMLFSAHGDPKLECEILDSLRQQKPAGVLLAPLGRASDRKHVEKFVADVPTVLFDNNLPDMGSSFVGMDNTQSMRMLVEYLCATGSAPNFFEMRVAVNPNVNRRRNAYIAAMEALGHTPEIIRVDGDGWEFEEIGRQGGLTAFATGRFTSDTILCSNDRLAIGLLSAAFISDLKVGQGPDAALRIAGHDDHPFSRFTCPSLTTVAQDYASMSDKSLEILMQMIDSEHQAQSQEDFLFDGILTKRASA